MPTKPTLLSGGNPQIPKGYGDAPVQVSLLFAPSNAGRGASAPFGFAP